MTLGLRLQRLEQVEDPSIHKRSITQRTEITVIGSTLRI